MFSTKKIKIINNTGKLCFEINHEVNNVSFKCLGYIASTSVFPFHIVVMETRHVKNQTTQLRNTSPGHRPGNLDSSRCSTVLCTAVSRN